MNMIKLRNLPSVSGYINLTKSIIASSSTYELLLSNVDID